MQAHAGRANEQLRKFRKIYDEDEDRFKKIVDERALRQEMRFWKRMAMPELEEDDPYWSDDDDVIDPAEKIRLRELQLKAQQEQIHDDAAEDSDDAQRSLTTMGMMGGFVMQREDSAEHGVPVLPPRPLSAGSTGSTG